MDRGAWQTMVREVTKGLYTTEETKHINSYAEDLTPSTSECDYIWVFKEVVGDSDSRVPAELGQESQTSSCVE